MNPSQRVERTTSEEITHLNETIVDENARFARSNELKNEQMLSIVQSDIAAEQFDTFHDVLTKAVTVPYEVMGSRAIALESQIQTAEGTVIQASAELLNDAELAIHLAPRKADDIEKLKTDILEQSRQDSVMSLKAELDQIYASIDEHGAAWEIPQAIPPIDRAMLYRMILENADEQQADAMFEDIIPITPEERAGLADAAERAKSVIENPDASRHIVFYLSENVNKVVTVEELARFLYVADVNGDNHRSHVTTMLGPKIQGKRIQRMLHDDHGLELQYGMRILRQEENGRLVERRRTRIYRVVEPQQNHDTPESVIETVLPEQKLVTDVFDPIVREVPIAQVSEVQETDLGTDDVEVKEHADDWYVGFEASVLDVITRLKDDNLFEADVMRGSAVRSMSSSSLLGTKTNRERMQKANLLKVSQLKTDEMSREQRVLGLLFNTNSNILTQKSTRKQALEIVQKCISDNLEV